VNPFARYEIQLTNRYSHIGPFGRLKITGIFNMLQDAAAEHASKLKISGLDIAKQNLFWVISRYRLRIGKNPAIGEPLYLSTWRVSVNNLYEHRFFRILDGKDRTIVNAVGQWVMVSRKNGRPCRLTTYMPESMLSGPPTKEDQEFSKIIPLEQSDLEYRFKIRMHDLDLNRHVNNSVYVEWAVESVPGEILERYTPETINVRFFKESFLQDHITSATRIEWNNGPPFTIHSIQRSGSGEGLAGINIKWKPMEQS